MLQLKKLAEIHVLLLTLSCYEIYKQDIHCLHCLTEIVLGRFSTFFKDAGPPWTFPLKVLWHRGEVERLRYPVGPHHLSVMTRGRGLD